MTLMILSGNLRSDYYGQELSQVAELIVEAGLLTNKMSI